MDPKAAIVADMDTPDFTFPRGQSVQVVSEERKETPPKG